MRTIAGRMKGGHWALAREEYEAVCQALDAGHLIVYPTDTLYGLGCDPFEDRAVERVFEVKRRPAEQPIALALSSPDQVPRAGPPRRPGDREGLRPDHDHEREPPRRAVPRDVRRGEGPARGRGRRVRRLRAHPPREGGHDPRP